MKKTLYSILDTFTKMNVRKRSVFFLIVLLITVPILTSSLHTEVGDDVVREGIVTIKGEEVFRIGLNSKTPHQEVTLYPQKGEYAVLEIQGPRIRIKEDSTSSQFAVKKGWIQHPGESTVSLDQGLLLRIRSVEIATKEEPDQKEEIDYPF